MQQLTHLRATLFREIAPQLNDLFQYFAFVGDWKRWTPVDIITMKRRVDREFNSVAPLFEEVTHDAYRDFMDACFDTYGEWSTDARLNTSWPERMDGLGTTWNLEEWPSLFTHASAEAVSEQAMENFRIAYDRLMACLAADVKLTAPRDSYASPDILMNAG